MFKLLEPLLFLPLRSRSLKPNISISHSCLVSLIVRPRFCSSVVSANQNKHNIKVLEPTKPTKYEDILLQNIRSCKEVDGILDAVRRHHFIMNREHITYALRTLHLLQSANCSSMHKSQVLKSREFELLCKKLHKESRAMDVTSLINNLKVLSYFQVPVTSALVQGILHLIKHQINDLSLQEITFLSFLFSKFGQDSLADALNIALPLVFASKLNIQLDRENVKEMVGLLHYAAFNGVSDECCEELVRSLSKCGLASLTSQDALKVAVAVFNVKYFSTEQVTLGHLALNKIATTLNQFKLLQLKHLMGAYIEKYLKHYEFYNENFLNCYVEHMIKNEYDFEEIVWTMKKVTAAAHTSISLLDYIAMRLESDPNCLKHNRFDIIITTPSGFANANYMPQNWNRIKTSILECWKFLPKDDFQLPWIKYTLELASLNCFDNELLQFIFNQQFLEKYLKRENKLDYIQLLTLYQAVKVLHPEYDGLFPPEHLIQKAQELNGTNVTTFPLKASLQKAFGGEAYVQTKIYTKMGHFIDHAIVLRRGGFPVALNQVNPEITSERVFIEDFIIPDDCQIVLVLVISPGSLSRNGKRLRGGLALRAKTLEARGYKVVIIATELWQELNDREKIPYLMQAIRLKSSDHYEQFVSY